MRERAVDNSIREELLIYVIQSETADWERKADNTSRNYELKLCADAW